MGGHMKDAKTLATRPRATVLNTKVLASFS